MSISVKVGNQLKELSKSFQLKLTGPVAAELDRQLEQAIGGIVSRTQSGQGVNGEALKAYTPEYRNIKNGLSASGNPTRKLTTRRRTKRAQGIAGRGDTVNLTYSGKMLQGIRAKVESVARAIVGKIFFLPTEANKARYNQETRKFFGLSDEQIAQIKQAIREALK